MKKLVLLALLLTAGLSQAQSVTFGIKGGANFSTIDGKTGSQNLDYKTGYHVGAIMEVSLFRILDIQPEIIYSTQGAKVENGGKDIELNYINVPIMLKLGLVPGVVNLEVGPQFGFLTDKNIAKTYETEDFDYALAGGLGVDLGNTFFIQARYVAGLSEVSKKAELKNNTIQLSVGLYF